MFDGSKCIFGKKTFTGVDKFPFLHKVFALGLLSSEYCFNV